MPDLSAMTIADLERLEDSLGEELRDMYPYASMRTLDRVAERLRSVRNELNRREQAPA